MRRLRSQAVQRITITVCTKQIVFYIIIFLIRIMSEPCLNDPICFTSRRCFLGRFQKVEEYPRNDAKDA